MSEEKLKELIDWINEQKDTAMSGYLAATDEETKTMYSSENAAYGLTLIKIKKLLSSEL